MPHLLLTPSQMALADTLAAIAGTPGLWLMENAGRAVARAARRRFAPCRTLVLCGPGNNGGDGYVTARHLDHAGWPVTVAALAPPRPGSDASQMALLWRGPTTVFSPHAAARATLVIDAVFGAGLARDVEGITAATLAAASKILAIDIPSGVDGATGAVRGRAAAAELTVTFVRRKPGHLLLPGRILCGATLLADIGMPPGILGKITADTFANLPGLWTLPQSRAIDHKYTRGHVTVLGGAMTGAARLAAAAARRAGAGLVSIATGPAGAATYRTGEPGVIVVEASLRELLRDTRRQVWVCGPGLGVEAARQALVQLLAAGRHVVVDADALTAHAGQPDALRGAAVLTPHAGEFARVFGDPGHDRLGAARAAASRTGAVVLLKGADTVIAAPDGRAAINADAPPYLATAGAGDVLSGIIAALMAQQLPPWQAACAGAWLHGRAGVLAGFGLIAEDLPGRLPQAMQDAAQKGHA